MASSATPTPAVSIIVGCDGQDGHYLSQLLHAHGHRVIGVNRRNCDILDRAQVATLIAEQRPSQIYYLAGYFGSSESAAQDPYELFVRSREAHIDGWHNFLDEAGRAKAPARLFYAASSRVFGDPRESPQSERTPMEPRCVYGITKTSGVHLGRYYRKRGLFCSSGILYNHESPLRPPTFVSRKIVKAAVDNKLGAAVELRLGNLQATVDWGAAQDYVEAMRLVLAADEPGDFVIASGKARTVRQFVEAAYGVLGIAWEPYVKEDKSLLASAPARPDCPVVGDASRLREITGWQPRLDFAEMVRQMVEAEMDSRAA
jgi:GDPmannose 4,6-dehydratase